MREYTAQEVEHTIQGYPMVNAVHLCDSCSFELPNCEDEEERFNTIPK